MSNPVPPKQQSDGLHYGPLLLDWLRRHRDSVHTTEVLEPGLNKFTLTDGREVVHSIHLKNKNDEHLYWTAQFIPARLRRRLNRLGL